MGRTCVNLIGNCLATVVVARWEGEFDHTRAKIFGTATEAKLDLKDGDVAFAEPSGKATNFTSAQTYDLKKFKSRRCTQLWSQGRLRHRLARIAEHSW
jgi:hypothetical protein